MKRGFSVLEAVLACALFSLASLCLFGLMQFGFRAFSMGGQRMGLQAEQEAILMHLRADLEFTTVSSLRVADGGPRNVVVPLSVGPTNEPRHQLCCCGLTDWNAKNNYNPQSGLPNWDLYLIYQADLAPQGSLFRVEMGPVYYANDEGWNQFSSYSAAFPNLPPGLGANVAGLVVRRRQRLSSNLLGFEVTKASSDLVVRLLLFNSSAYRDPAGGSRRSQVLETKTRIAIRNRSH
ncbi:hypothetical protein JST97_14865 [bacterium]|nr:hypothetical protein [bacterium]